MAVEASDNVPLLEPVRLNAPSGTQPLPARRNRIAALSAEEKRKFLDDCIIHARKRPEEAFVYLLICTQTNDSSIASKRSVSRLYHAHEPDFYEPFTAKIQRRHPLINRGYWLRMQAIEQVVRKYLEQPSEKPKTVINLGAGYDPLPWQIWHRHPNNCLDTKFIDVDYPESVRQKEIFILENASLSEHLPDLSLSNDADDVPICNSSRYAAIGCDLSRLSKLQDVLERDFDIHNRSILFIAEVSITYMRTLDADAVIKWAASFPHARFGLLEQYLPDGPRHPFAETMLKHFKKLNSTLHSIQTYPTLADQKRRFHKNGWETVHIQNLWSLWHDVEKITPARRRILDEAEAFDEWEEFALFAGHYFILEAHNYDPSPTETFAHKNPSTSGEAPGASDGAAAKNMTFCATLKPAVRSDLSTREDSVRRFAAGYSHGHAFQYHGGFGLQKRLASETLWLKTGADWVVLSREASFPSPRMCHTVTKFGHDEYLMCGGRASPAKAFEECYVSTQSSIQDEMQWSPTGTLSPARYRHCSVAVQGTDALQAVIVFGGKTGTGQVLDDWRYFGDAQRWMPVRIVGATPPARFGAAMCTDANESSGIILGGMDEYGCILSDAWAWNVVHEAGEVHIHCHELAREVDLHLSVNSVARFGASLVPTGESSFVICGGVGMNGVLLANDEVVSVRREGSVLTFTGLNILERHGPRPLLIGCNMTSTSPAQNLISGGGAVCFSFGSFHNTHGFVLETARSSKTEQPRLAGIRLPKVSKVPVRRSVSKESFTEILSTSRPVIMRGVDIGPCTSKWSTQYLLDKIGTEESIVVHSCPTNRMKFQDKNFTYVKQSFGDFIHSIERGERLYLRSVSKKQPFKQPTKLSEDFPHIADDFVLPEALEYVREHMHSSPLRISGPVILWLHYDVLANVLCQVTGSKTIRLYPPSDVNQLQFSPGSSSSNINVFSSEDASLSLTHPFDADLERGDVLFIPPMWMHTAKPTSGVSVAVNVFFRNLETGYAAGRDVYGNRDLHCYEQGRKDVEKMVRSFQGIPSDIRRFYVDRLAAELTAQAAEQGTDELAAVNPGC